MTLFEVLIALSILALVTAVVVAARPAPSPELQLRTEASRLFEDASAHRHRAVETGTDVLWRPDALDCNGNAVEGQMFHDGTAEGLDICIEIEGRRLRLEMDVLAGGLVERPL